MCVVDIFTLPRYKNIIMEYKDRLQEILNLGYRILSEKISHGSILIDNESSFQLQFAYILKTLGVLYEFRNDERFIVQLENHIDLDTSSIKSRSNWARVDIMYSIGTVSSFARCAIELKYFKKENHREPNNRYDVFKDLWNLEVYKNNGIDLCCFILATDHSHYVNQTSYSPDTGDFDFRNGKNYKAGTVLTYRTEKPYGDSLSLKNDYSFNWDTINNNYYLKIIV